GGAEGLGEEADDVGDDQEGERLVERSQVAGADEDEGEGDDDSRETIGEVADALDPGCGATAVADGEDGDWEGGDSRDGGGPAADHDRMHRGGTEAGEAIASRQGANQPVAKDAERKPE